METMSLTALLAPVQSAPAAAPSGAADGDLFTRILETVISGLAAGAANQEVCAEELPVPAEGLPGEESETEEPTSSSLLLASAGQPAAEAAPLSGPAEETSQTGGQTSEASQSGGPASEFSQTGGPVHAAADPGFLPESLIPVFAPAAEARGPLEPSRAETRPLTPPAGTVNVPAGPAGIADAKAGVGDLPLGTEGAYAPAAAETGAAPSISAAGEFAAVTDRAASAAPASTGGSRPEKTEIKNRAAGAAERAQTLAEAGAPPAGRPLSEGEGSSKTGEGRERHGFTQSGAEQPEAGRQSAPEAAPLKEHTPPAGAAEFRGRTGEVFEAAPAQRAAGSALSPASVERLVSAAGRLELAASGRLSLELNEAELGKVRVEMSLNGGEVRISLEVENGDAGRLLSAKAPELVDALAQRGVSSGVEVFSGGGRGNENRGREGRSSARRYGRAAEAAPQDAPAAEEGRISLYA